MGGGKALAYLDAIRRDYPISLHGVGLSLGSAEGIDDAHLERIRLAVERFEPGLVSEHLAWNVVDGIYLADLLPLPMTEEALDLVCRQRRSDPGDSQAADPDREPVVRICNSSHSSIPEWEFLAAVAERTGCGILCDVNNIYVSACNHGWDASAYLDGAAGRRRRRDPPGRSRRSAHPTARTCCASMTTARASPPAGLGALCGGAGALWSGADPDRMGHRHSGARGAARRSGAGPDASADVAWTGRRPCRRCVKCNTPCGASLVEQDDAAGCHLRRCDELAPRAASRYLSQHVRRQSHQALALCPTPPSIGSSARMFFEGAAQIFVAPTAAARRLSRRVRRRVSRFPAALSAGGVASPICADVARLEWAVTRALHAPDVNPLDAAAACRPRSGGSRARRVSSRIRRCRSCAPIIRRTRSGGPSWRRMTQHLAAIDLGRRSDAGCLSSAARPASRLRASMSAGMALRRCALRRPTARHCARNRVRPMHPSLLAEHIAGGSVRRIQSCRAGHRQPRVRENRFVSQPMNAPAPASGPKSRSSGRVLNDPALDRRAVHRSWRFRCVLPSPRSSGIRR